MRRLPREVILIPKSLERFFVFHLVPPRTRFAHSDSSCREKFRSTGKEKAFDGRGLRPGAPAVLGHRRYATKLFPNPTSLRAERHMSSPASIQRLFDTPLSTS